MGFTRNVVSYYGLDNTNTNDIIPTVTGTIKTDLTGQDTCVLDWDAGTYRVATNPGNWIPAVSDLTFNLTGATLTDNGVTRGMPISSTHLTGLGIDEAGGKSARIQTVYPGATSVTLTAASASAGHISRFSVGQYILVCGWEMLGAFQNPYGFPPNFHWNEYVEITGIVGDTISFTPALQNFYDQNWPELHRGSSLEVDAGGPASIFALSDNWNGSTTLNNGTLTQKSGSSDTFINCYRRVFTANGLTCSDSSIYPSVQKTFRAINCTSSGVLVEADKNVDLVDIQGGTWSGWNYQSSSTRMLSMSGVAITNSLTGTPRHATLDNCTIGGNLRIGATGYGRGESLTCRNTSIAGTITGGLFENGPRDEGLHNCIFMNATGILTIPMSLGESILRIMMPDGSGRNVLYWTNSSHGAFKPFKPLSVTSDAWPSADRQTATTNVTMSSVTNTRTLTVSTSLFSSGDVGKVIKLPGVGSGGATIWTFITAYTSATSVEVFDPCLTTNSGVSRAIEWGTCNYYVRTDQTSIPGSSLYGTRLGIYCPAARSVYFENCTGGDDAVDLSQSGARNRPLLSYTKRAYTGTLPTNDTTTVKVFGELVSVKINVTRAYTGVGALTFQYVHRCLVSGATYDFYLPVVNLKVAGERVITTSGVTGTQSGDSALAFTVPTFVTTTSGVAKLSRNISGESSGDWPEFTLEVITDQGLPGSVAPLRLRLRAA